MARGSQCCGPEKGSALPSTHRSLEAGSTGVGSQWPGTTVRVLVVMSSPAGDWGGPPGRRGGGTGPGGHLGGGIAGGKTGGGTALTFKRLIRGNSSTNRRRTDATATNG